jgi:hypothetical protein
MGRSLLLALALLVPAAPAAASGHGVSGEDLAEIRAVIQRQIDAFRRDDARGAFALAAPGVQQVFGTPERFLEAVRFAYRAVYRAAALAFLDPMVMGGDVVQQLRITDRAGAVWLAYYAMQRQADGSWRASGCHLVQQAKTISASYRAQ